MPHENQKILAIINPIAGIGSKNQIPLLLYEHFGKQPEKELFIAYTKPENNVPSLVKQAVEWGVSTVIAVGGDGTVNEVASAIINTPLTMGIIPLGSGNGLARTLNIPLQQEAAIDVIKQQYAKRIDCGRANGKLFFTTFGVGFDAEVTKTYDEQTFRGPISYIVSAIDRYISHTPKDYIITINGERIHKRALMITCANADQYGNNAYIAPEAQVDDGLLDLVVAREVSPIEAPKFAFQLFTKQLNHNTAIELYSATHFTIERSEPGLVQIDGESGEMGRRIEIEVVPHALQIYTPKPTPQASK